MSTDKHAFYAEFEDDFGVEAGPHLAVTFGQHPGAHHPLDGRVGHLDGPTGQGEAVVLPGRRAGLAVQRVAPVSPQVLPLRSGHDEQVQARVADDRAHRVPPGRRRA